MKSVDFNINMTLALNLRKFVKGRSVLSSGAAQQSPILAIIHPKIRRKIMHNNLKGANVIDIHNICTIWHIDGAKMWVKGSVSLG